QVARVPAVFDGVDQNAPAVDRDGPGKGVGGADRQRPGAGLGQPAAAADRATAGKGVRLGGVDGRRAGVDVADDVHGRIRCSGIVEGDVVEVEELFGSAAVLPVGGRVEVPGVVVGSTGPDEVGGAGAA